MSIVKLNNQGVKNATAFGSITGLGSMVFIKKLTASSSATLSFVDGASGVVLDNTYKEYLFTFNNIHPEEDNRNFGFTLSIDGGSNYNVAKTTTIFYSYHDETGGYNGLTYHTGKDLAQGTGNQMVLVETGNDNDQSGNGYLRLFNPASTNFVKHFISVGNSYEATNNNQNSFVAGYGNTTSAVNGIQFSMSSGNTDSGDICLYGIA
nr:hypothetical protein [uncultured Mediterranean phage uvMED]